ncbi:MAG: SET domain-containing protein-lysine N-methyltransferase [Saprospiraceae bacterium]
MIFNIIKTKNQINPEFFEHIEAKESEYLYIDKSFIPNSGQGLFTAIPICKNEIISIFKGELLSNDEINKRAKLGNDQYFINTIDGFILDSAHTKCYAKYANDAQGRVKTKFKLNSIITIDDKNNICLVAIRSIKKGEEIYCSYGKKYWKNNNKLIG